MIDGIADQAPDAGAQPGARPWRQALLSGGYLWLAGHLLMAVATLFYAMPRGAPGESLDTWPAGASPGGLLERWMWWDTGHYLAIAEHGYGPPIPSESTAFYPLYPLFVRAFDSVLPGDGFVAALVVSSIAAYVMLVLLHRLASYELGEATAHRAGFYLVAFPFAFFLYIGYNESLFMAFALGALYAMRKGQWWVAGVLGAFSSATRSAGVLLAMVLLFEYLRQRRFQPRAIRWDVLSVALVPVGLACFSLYCKWKFDNAFAFSDAQNWWGRKLTLPWESVYSAVRTMNDVRVLHPQNLYNLVDVSFVLIAFAVLVLAVVGPWRLRADQFYLVVYGWASLGLAVLFPVSPPLALTSIPRYLLEIVAIFLVLAKMGQNRAFERFYLMAAIGMQAIWMVLFLNHLWAG
ncbi:mannosyltransferase family protein [Catellatospora paridis]|uniref:mannosyltransferase family protein n=1 Tax=Catellatospora paridis TaxID=1617086 RepID=UPI0018AF6D0F|nr:mannosyltransferase family protein [Catellatospora paridis]